MRLNSLQIHSIITRSPCAPPQPSPHARSPVGKQVATATKERKGRRAKKATRSVAGGKTNGEQRRDTRPRILRTAEPAAERCACMVAGARQCGTSGSDPEIQTIFTPIIPPRMHSRPLGRYKLQRWSVPSVKWL